MTTDGAVELLLGAILAWLTMAGPILMAALVMGVLVGVLQAATQINEASISFLTKLVAVGAVIVVLGSWSARQMVEYTTRTIGSIADVSR